MLVGLCAGGFMVGMLARMDEILINFGLVVVVGCVGGKILGVV